MHTCTSAIKPIEREVKVKVENFSKPPCCDVTVLGSLTNNDGDGDGYETGASNDGFLLNALKTPFRLPRVL